MFFFILQPPSLYSFAYAVKDEPSYNDFGHSENSDGKAVTGTYYVVLPDGRKQSVDYKVDAYSGYVADVNYNGIAYHPVAASYSPPAVPVALYVNEITPAAKPALVELPTATLAYGTKIEVGLPTHVAISIAPSYNAKKEDKNSESVPVIIAPAYGTKIQVSPVAVAVPVKTEVKEPAAAVELSAPAVATVYDSKIEVSNEIPVNDAKTEAYTEMEVTTESIAYVEASTVISVYHNDNTILKATTAEIVEEAEPVVDPIVVQLVVNKEEVKTEIIPPSTAEKAEVNPDVEMSKAVPEITKETEFITEPVLAVKEEETEAAPAIEKAVTAQVVPEKSEWIEPAGKTETTKVNNKRSYQYHPRRASPALNILTRRVIIITQHDIL